MEPYRKRQLREIVCSSKAMRLQEGNNKACFCCICQSFNTNQLQSSLVNSNLLLYAVCFVLLISPPLVWKWKCVWFATYTNIHNILCTKERNQISVIQKQQALMSRCIKHINGEKTFQLINKDIRRRLLNMVDTVQKSTAISKG